MKKVPELAVITQEIPPPDDPTLFKRQSTEIRETNHVALETDEFGDITQVNEYHVIRNLGRGAFAEVKLCRQVTGDDNKKGDLFAIKVFNKSLLKRQRSLARGPGRMKVNTALNKVQQEIAIMKKLCHDHLVQMFEVIDDPDGDQLYMVLEYVPNGTIMEWDECNETFYSRFTGSTYSEEQAAFHLMDIIAGMAYLHQHHICHRDLKPENILLTANNRCKIADFGVSHYFEQEEDRTPRALNYIYRSQSRGQLKTTEGTWSFWSPEMCESGSGGYSGYAADVWSIGVILWVMIFGKLPFVEETPPELFQAIANKPHEFPETDDFKPSDDVKDLLNRFLTKSAKERITIPEIRESTFFDYHSIKRKKSIPTVEVSQDDVTNAFSNVNSFILMTKVEMRLQNRLKQARRRIRDKENTQSYRKTTASLTTSFHDGNTDPDKEEEGSSSSPKRKGTSARKVSLYMSSTRSKLPKDCKKPCIIC